MTITIGGSNLSIEPLLLNRVSEEVRGTRQTLLFLISVILSIHVISFILVIYSLSINFRTNTYEPILILWWILFFSSGMFITQRYYITGLYMFAWLGILNMIVTCILIVFVTVAVVIITSQFPKESNGIPFTLIPVVTCLTTIILDAVIIIYSFKLWYIIIKNQKPSGHQRI
ncbi:unnamed protein product [Adineta steineri]|uniref:Uncharacterized protein n=2 Tax=Adineta steineri TaxID=433720 RepID=A0A819KVQ4_9BILA|nr:unnamed protein product [Adineta steineri]CAF3954921.1 unnamed protein product [Adineta steineri]